MCVCVVACVPPPPPACAGPACALLPCGPACVGAASAGGQAGLPLHQQAASAGVCVALPLPHTHPPQQSLVHPSHSPHMVDEQERTAQSNCGVRGPQLARPLAREGGSGGVRKGLVALVDLDPQTSSSASSSSPFNDNNERLEFLGDAILEFLCRLAGKHCSLLLTHSLTLHHNTHAHMQPPLVPPPPTPLGRRADHLPPGAGE